MDRVDLVIHDLSAALLGLSPAIRNKHEIYVKSLQSLVRFALSEQSCQSLEAIRRDEQKVREILEASKK